MIDSRKIAELISRFFKIVVNLQYFFIIESQKIIFQQFQHKYLSVI